MTNHPKIVTIFGGSGFVGKYISQQMARAGWRVRVAVRRPHEAIHVKPYGGVGQVEPIQANIRDEESTRAAIAGADAVINCVGILQEDGRQKFATVHAEGAARIARLAAEEGVSRLVHLSAIGANVDGKTAYARSKGEGEAAVLATFPSAVILRPSVIFGEEDNFFNRFAGMSRLSLVLPIVGANSLFQPVHVSDVAKAAAKAVLDDSVSGTYELGGPDRETLGELLERMLQVIRKRRIVLNLPFWVGNIMGKTWDFFSRISMGLFTNTILTADQVAQLRGDTVVSEGAQTLADLGIEPICMDAVLPEYLYRFRPYGQYSDLTNSADNLSGVKNTQPTAK